jgi:hypothetical protein
VHQLKVERKGGLAGFGLPNSRVRSVGSVDLRTLSASDRRAVKGLFAGRPAHLTPASAVQADAFQYHLTMTTAEGETTVVAAEHEVPDAIRDAVHDTL